VNSLAFSPDSKLLASGSWDTKARLYGLAGAAPRLEHTLDNSEPDTTD